MNYSGFATVFEFDTGATPSIFAGYLMQRGNVVYGGELAYSQGDDATIVGFASESLGTMLDLKARVGMTANNALFYGVLGYSKVDYHFGSVGNQETAGLNYGVGVDFAVSNRLFLGAEYLVRKTDGDANLGLTRNLDLNTFGVRLGLSF